MCAHAYQFYRVLIWTENTLKGDRKKRGMHKTAARWRDYENSCEILFRIVMLEDKIIKISSENI